MKVAIVTFVRACNYGAVLQTYALNKVILDLGAESKVIDYYPSCFYNSYNLCAYGKLRRKPSRHIKWWIKNNLLFIRVRRRNNQFDRFLKKYIQVTKEQYHDVSELSKCNDYDVYISGSDQVWNPYLCDFDEAFFLSFCKDKKRLSYAASFGITEIPEQYINEYKKRLSNWAGYSVREDSGVELIAQLVGEKALCHCDPTLLLNSNDWITSLSLKKNKSDFIVVYCVNVSDNLLRCAQELSKKFGLKVYCLHCVMRPQYFNKLDNDYGFKILYSASPKDFLTYILNAKYVLTDSFHGTVFSIIFHKAFLCETVRKDGFINKRVADLLEALALCNRVLDDNSFDTIKKKIEWEKVDNKLLKLKKKGIDYLTSRIKKECMTNEDFNNYTGL